MSKICPVCERVYEDEHVFCASDGTALQGFGMGVDDLIGSVVDDRYVIESVLGAGGMGRVYLGHHVHLPRKVAIKVLQSKLTNDPAAIARFNREAASTSRIENLHVARVFDFGRMGSGATYLAMEYIPGRTLTELLDQEGALTPMRVVELIGQVADGLGAAHRLDIVHRDLKPDNILIMEDDDGQECVKIVDFGIAKAIGPDDQGTLTAPGFVTGTPEYMSPEQFLGQTIDRRSDVFALGLLAFRALTNSQPFAKPTPERGFSAVLVDAPHRLDQVAPAQRWPKDLQAVFDRVLQRDPEARYPTAAAFADALREAFELPAVRMLGSRSTPAMGATTIDRHTRVLSGGHASVAPAQATERFAHNDRRGAIGHRAVEMSGDVGDQRVHVQRLVSQPKCDDTITVGEQAYLPVKQQAGPVETWDVNQRRSFTVHVQPRGIIRLRRRYSVVGGIVQ